MAKRLVATWISRSIPGFAAMALTVVLVWAMPALPVAPTAQAVSGSGVILDSITSAGRDYFDVAVDNDIAYVAEGDAGLEVIDVSDPDTITTEDTLDTGGEARGVAFDGDCVYVADFDEGIVSVNVRDTGDITENDTQTTEGDALKLFLDTDNNYLYVAMGDDGIGIYEVDDCDFGDELMDAFDVGGDVQDIFVDTDNEIAYLASGSDGFISVDVSDPEDPTELDTFNADGDAVGVYIDGDYAYIAQSDEGLLILDISDPANMVETDTANSSDDALDVFVDNDIAYVAVSEDGIQTFDVSDPTSIDEEDDDDMSLSTGETAVSVYVVDDIAFVAVDEDGFYALDTGEIGGSSSGSGSGEGFPDLDNGDLYVDANASIASPDGSADEPYDTIQEALDEASSGDRIIVYPGVYDENIEIDSDDVELIGVGPSFVSLSVSSDDVVTITADGVTLQGFTLVGGDIGVLVDAVDDITIQNTVITGNDESAIHFDESTGTVINNTIFDNAENGILVDDADDLTITNNIISDSGAAAIDVNSGATTGIDLSYNLYFNNDDDLVGITADSTDIEDEDPDFEDEDDDDFDWDDRSDWEDDFRLSTNSPGEDAGDPTVSDADDSDSDIGAHGGPVAESDDGEDPDDVEGLEVTGSNGSATLSWDENTERDLYGYYVFRSTAQTGTFTQINDNPFIGTTFVDAGRTAGTYYYYITAVDFYEDQGDESDAESTTIGTGTGTGNYPNAAQFNDSGTFGEFIMYIDQLAGAGVVNGYADGGFHPFTNVTRAELLKMSLRGANMDTAALATQASGFSDVPRNHSLIQYINYAAANGIVSGQSGRFRPNDPVSRFEATKIIMETFDLARAVNAQSSFIDVTIAEMVSYIEGARARSIINGIGNRFYPNNSLTRAEAAKIIAGAMNLP